VLPYPSPGRGITASRWRFGMVSRCSAYGAQGQPRTEGREGDKSVEAVPRPVVDVQPYTKTPGRA